MADAKVNTRRFIPAWAGNRPVVGFVGHGRAVHPRVGGEQAFRPERPKNDTGSSPRGRGTERVKVKADVIHRFIPAWAGNSSSEVAKRRSNPVHPRVGGEQDIAFDPTANQAGSSPRGRGTGSPAR